MGLAPLIVVLKKMTIRKNDDNYNQAASFWAKIFGINFAIGCDGHEKGSVLRSLSRCRLCVAKEPN